MINTDTHHIDVTMSDGRRLRELTAITSTNATAVFTAASRTAPVVESVHIANEDPSNACTVLVTLYDGTSTYTLYPTKSLAAATSLTLSPLTANFPNLPLDEGDEIRVTAQAANDLVVCVVCRDSVGNVR